MSVHSSNDRGRRRRPALNPSRRITRPVRAGVVLPDGLVIPAGLDPVMADLIAQVNTPDHRAWMNQVARIGGCARPLHVKGYTRLRDSVTGEVDYEFNSRAAPGGVLLVRCRNRRAAVCPSCAYLYQGDVYQLVRAGLIGGKGVPDTVAGHPRVFATLTAPSFGAVHSTRTGKSGKPLPCHPRRSSQCPHHRATTCVTRHGEGDALVGTPLCSDCYRYQDAVIWQASVGRLWHHFTTALPGHLGKVTGRSRDDVRKQVRFSYVKIVEYQRRGLIHVHAVIRADGIPAQEHDDKSAASAITAPAWVTPALIEETIMSAAGAVRVRVDGGRAGSWVLGWGEQLDVHDITERVNGQSSGKVAAYVAKYATKSTEVTGWDSSGLQSTPRAAHTAAMATAAYSLAEVPELAGLNLRRWVKELAYRGHVSSKSRRYSTTLGALRLARAVHQSDAGQIMTRPGGGLVVESSWELAGHGYTPGQALLAADVARDIDVNRAAAREAGAARPRAGGRDKLTRPDSVRERGAREAPQSG